MPWMYLKILQIDSIQKYSTQSKNVRFSPVQSFFVKDWDTQGRARSEELEGLTYNREPH